MRALKRALPILSIPVAASPDRYMFLHTQAIQSSTFNYNNVRVHVIDYTYCFSNCMWSLTCLRSSGLFPVFLMLWWLRYHFQFFFLPHGEIYLFPYSDAQSLLMSLPYIAPHSFVRSQLAAFGASGQCFS